MPKILLVYHSRTGSCEKVALELRGRRGWVLGEIWPTHRVGYWRCALQAMLRREPAITYRGPDPAVFDVVLLVAPVWCATLSAPMRSFVARHRAALRNVALVSVMGGRGAPGAVAAVEGLLAHPALASMALVQADVRSGGFRRALREFAIGLEDAALAGSAPTPTPLVRAAG